MYYVYELYDSTGTKYIGKGSGDRIDAHERDTVAKLAFNATHRNKMRLSRKEQWIANLLMRGEEVGKRIVYRTSNEAEAYAEEARRIKAAPFLYNIVGRMPRKHAHVARHYRWD